mmetsp:Transcript_19479/g.74718  ORF Transcript_19479/g.74718 Transcript_19479/m.74718 type:complete len:220 (-) Transcript_19479:1917-2576(-)
MRAITKESRITSPPLILGRSASSSCVTQPPAEVMRARSRSPPGLCGGTMSTAETRPNCSGQSLAVRVGTPESLSATVPAEAVCPSQSAAVAEASGQPPAGAVPATMARQSPTDATTTIRAVWSTSATSAVVPDPMPPVPGNSSASGSPSLIRSTRRPKAVSVSWNACTKDGPTSAATVPGLVPAGSSARAGSTRWSSLAGMSRATNSAAAHPECPSNTP